jgi:biotin carboxyl carrier protein
MGHSDPPHYRAQFVGQLGGQMAIIRSEITGSVWQIKVAVGDTVAAGDEVVVLESMKMEIPVHSPSDGTVRTLFVATESRVQEGDELVEIEAEA